MWTVTCTVAQDQDGPGGFVTGNNLGQLEDPETGRGEMMPRGSWPHGGKLDSTCPGSCARAVAVRPRATCCSEGEAEAGDAKRGEVAGVH